jgi:hypothetical protein
MAATRTPEATQLAEAIAKHVGNGAVTPSQLAAELVSLEAPTDLLAAFEDALSRAAAAQEWHGFDDALWGPAPTESELAEARRRARAELDDALAVALSDALGREAVARRLGISPQAVSKRLGAGSLVALSRGRAKHFPAWQFHEDGVLPGLAEVIDAYPGTPLALTVWATSPSADLDGRTPAEALTERGGVQRVVDAAQALSPAAW